MTIILSCEDIRNYEKLIDNVNTYRSLLLISKEYSKNNNSTSLDSSKIYKDYQKSKEKIIKWIANTESKYGIHIFGKRYSVNFTTFELEILDN